MSFKVALNFEDGVTRFIQCQAGETVLDAAYRNQINLPMDCADGVCGTCKGDCHQGQYELGEDYLDDALTEQEAAEGKVLTCQMVPSSDCVVQIPAASTLCKVGQAEIQGRITDVKLISPGAIELRVATDEPLAFLPGQYMNIQVPGSSETRSYSFSSLPGEREFSFLIRNVAGGLMSSWLVDQAKSGDQLTLSGPLGVFYLRPVTRPILMLAGGTGLSPFLSMLEQVRTTGTSQPIHLVCGVSRDEDLVGLDALQTLADEIGGFSFKTVVSGAASSHPRKGYVTHHLDEAPLNGGEVDVYVCGPPPMVDGALNYFREQGITPRAFHYERFTPSTPLRAGEVA